MLRALVAPFIDLLVPPRQSERLVRSLTIEDLYNVQTQEGLPYHNEAVRALVWEIKYFANPRAAALAGELLAEEVVVLAAEEIGVPLLIPVPMHAARRRERGHNQTEVLCRAMLPYLRNAIEYNPKVLKRAIDTQTQQGLERQKRLKNVKGSMTAENVEGRVCIVIDDVTTTGATLHEARRALRLAGARAVHCVTLTYS